MLMAKGPTDAPFGVRSFGPFSATNVCYLNASPPGVSSMGSGSFLLLSGFVFASPC